MGTVRVERCPDCHALVGEGQLYEHRQKHHLAMTPTPPDPLSQPPTRDLCEQIRRSLRGQHPCRAFTGDPLHGSCCGESWKTHLLRDALEALTSPPAAEPTAEEPLSSARSSDPPRARTHSLSTGRCTRCDAIYPDHDASCVHAAYEAETQALRKIGPIEATCACGPDICAHNGHRFTPTGPCKVLNAGEQRLAEMTAKHDRLMVFIGDASPKSEKLRQEMEARWKRTNELEAQLAEMTKELAALRERERQAVIEALERVRKAIVPGSIRGVDVHHLLDLEIERHQPQPDPPQPEKRGGNP